MPKPLADRVADMGPRSLIREMTDLLAERRRTYQGRVINLGQGTPPFSLPEYVKERIAHAILHEPDINRYTLQPGLPELREAVAEKIGARPEDVYISAGSMAGLGQAVASVVNPGDEVILTNPHYEPMRIVTLMWGGVPVYAPLMEEEGWKLDMERLRDSVSERTKLIVINTPANPTGKIFSEDDIREVAGIAAENGTYVLCDEAYRFLTYDGERHVSMMSLGIQEMDELLVTCLTASKEEAMTGFRVGYVHTRNRKLLDAMIKFHDAQSICAPSLSQFAAYFALTGSRDHVEGFRTELDRRRKLLREKAAEIDGFEYAEPKGAYYAFVRYERDISSLDYSKRLLAEEGVATIPGETFGSLGQGHIRISFAAAPEDIEEGMERIKDFQKRLA